MAFQILSLSGGGFFGLFTASILAELERQIDGPIASRFDLIAGTSVGGIIALGIANEVPAAQIRDAFDSQGQNIFSDRAAPKSFPGKVLDLRRSLLKPKYEVGALRATINSILGEHTLIGDLKHPCMVPAVNLTKGSPQIFKTDHHPDFKTDHIRRAVDVALATAAAPTYFPIATVGDELFADGGLYANSPDLIALHEAEHFFKVSLDQISLLSIGTTTTRFSFAHNAGVNFGILRWAMGQRLVQAMLSSQQLLVDFMLRHKLGDRYVRLDALQSREQEQDLGLDVATPAARQTIKGLAAATIRTAANDKNLARILAIRSTPPRFYYRKNL